MVKVRITAKAMVSLTRVIEVEDLEEAQELIDNEEDRECNIYLDEADSVDLDYYEDSWADIIKEGK